MGSFGPNHRHVCSIECLRAALPTRSGLPELACLGEDRSHQIVIGRQIGVQRLEYETHRFWQWSRGELDELGGPGVGNKCW